MNVTAGSLSVAVAGDGISPQTFDQVGRCIGASKADDWAKFVQVFFELIETHRTPSDWKKLFMYVICDGTYLRALAVHYWGMRQHEDGVPEFLIGCKSAHDLTLPPKLLEEFERHVKASTVSV